MERVWYASPNGDWWGGSDMDYVMVLKESDLPEGFEPDDIEGDNFADIIAENGTAAYIEVANQ